MQRQQRLRLASSCLSADLLAPPVLLAELAELPLLGVTDLRVTSLPVGARRHVHLAIESALAQLELDALTAPTAGPVPPAVQARVAVLRNGMDPVAVDLTGVAGQIGASLRLGSALTVPEAVGACQQLNLCVERLTQKGLARHQLVFAYIDLDAPSVHPLFGNPSQLLADMLGSFHAVCDTAILNLAKQAGADKKQRAANNARRHKPVAAARLAEIEKNAERELDRRIHAELLRVEQSLRFQVSGQPPNTVIVFFRDQQMGLRVPFVSDAARDQLITSLLGVPMSCPVCGEGGTEFKSCLACAALTCCACSDRLMQRGLLCNVCCAPFVA